MAEHGKDIQHAPGTNPGSAISPPTVYSSSSVNKSGSKPDASVSQKSGSGTVVNVTTINDSTEFRADAANLYQTFTDPQRIAAFTRAPPKFTGAKPGAVFELFGGNVSGEYVELQEPHTLSRNGGWPNGLPGTTRHSRSGLTKTTSMPLQLCGLSGKASPSVKRSPQRPTGINTTSGVSNKPLVLVRYYEHR